MQRSLRSIGLIAAGGFALAALAWVALRPDPVAVDLALVERGPMQVTIDADAKTRIREIFTVSSPIAGTARRLPLKVGDQIQHAFAHIGHTARQFANFIAHRE